MKAAGYNVVYKGKWHCSKPAGKEDAQPVRSRKVRLPALEPARRRRQPERARGRRRLHRQRRPLHRIGRHRRRTATEGALQYLSSTAAKQQPFFMVISLVNPHDVLFYPSKSFEEAGYDESWLEGDIHVPETGEEDLSTKPSVQEQFLRIFNLTGKPKNREQMRNYLNFYGNLMRSSDSYLVNVLDKLEETGLFDDTLIVRTADHGEMGLTHGGLRQKNFNFYEEATRVPLVYSNPKLFPKPAQTEALVSHVDFLPTLASLAAAPKSARANWQGVDYSKLVLHPNTDKLGPGLRRLHLRRLPVRARKAGPYPKAAEPHRQHPRRALEAGQVLRRQRKPGAAAVGDVRPEDRPAGEEEPRLQRPQTHAHAGERIQTPQTQARPGRKDPPEVAVATMSRSALRTALAAICVLLLLVPAAASARPHRQGIQIAVLGCVTGNSEVAARRGCQALPGARQEDGQSSLAGVVGLVPGREGKSLYAVANMSSAIARLALGPAPGKIAFGTCFTGDSFLSECTNVPGAQANAGDSPLAKPTAEAISPDGRSLYVTSGDFHDATVARFARDPISGELPTWIAFRAARAQVQAGPGPAR